MTARVLVLGTAQDGGFPHAGCGCASCAAARRDPARRRLVSCIGVVGATGRCLLVDATPDFAEQMARMARAADRPPPALDALVLTHAHVGHYLGLALLGREVLSAHGVPVYCTASMGRFVRENRPWSHLVERGEIALRDIRPGAPLAFDGLTLHAFLSPHRGEDTDTIGLEVHGLRRRLLYVSDADHFPDALAERIRGVDVALVDGTFHARDELKHRDIREVRHPLVTESVVRLAGARGEVWFTHLNHTNALLGDDPPALPAGFGVAAEEQVFPI